MVASLAAPTRALLFEPDRPPDIYPSRRPSGWRRRPDGYKRAVWERHHEDDAWGAKVQEIVLRYTLHGVERRQIAREYGLSERQVQAYLTGNGARPSAAFYAAPVRRALLRLGLPPGRLSADKRQRVVTRIAGLAADVVALLDGDERPLAQEVCAAMRLLASAPVAGEGQP